jgi:hypothetical protein
MPGSVGCLAQLGEHRPYKARVGGSNPSAPTRLKRLLIAWKLNFQATNISPEQFLQDKQSASLCIGLLTRLLTGVSNMSR